jgi:hypothetical protein
MILQWKKTVLTLRNWGSKSYWSYDLAHADQNGMAKLEQLNKMLKQKDTRWLEWLPSSPEEIAAAKNNSVWHLTSILRCNNCKTIERANQVLFYSKKEL